MDFHALGFKYETTHHLTEQTEAHHCQQAPISPLQPRASASRTTLFELVVLGPRGPPLCRALEYTGSVNGVDPTDSRIESTREGGLDQWTRNWLWLGHNTSFWGKERDVSNPTGASQYRTLSKNRMRNATGGFRLLEHRGRQPSCREPVSPK